MCSIRKPPKRDANNAQLEICAQKSGQRRDIFHSELPAFEGFRIFMLPQRASEKSIPPTSPAFLHQFNRSEGQAAIEMAVALPLLALFLLITVQFFHVGAMAMKNLMYAEYQIAEAIQEWMSPDSDHESGWPCLEDIPVGADGRVKINGDPVSIGFGAWKTEINVPQEVRFVADPICEN